MALRFGAIYVTISSYCDMGAIRVDAYDNFSHKSDSNAMLNSFLIFKIHIVK